MQPLQTPTGPQEQEQIQPDKPEDLNEADQLLADRQAAIEAEAQKLLEQEGTPEPDATPEQPQAQPEVIPATPTPAAPAIDYEKKFKESSREAQNLLAEKRQAQAQLDQLTNINITENELRALYPDWETMNDIEKRAFRETALANKKANQALNFAMGIVEQQRWNEDFAKVLKANPKLQGRDEDFKAYAYKPAHKNVPIDVLVKSFLFDLPADTPSTTPQPTPGLERGSGGLRTGNPADADVSEEVMAQLRVSDPKRYRQLLISQIKKEKRR